MIPEKINISARVDLTLKKIVEESTFNHKDAYELGAKLIAIGDAEETMEIINSDPVLQKNLNGIICKPPFLIHGMEACLYEKKVFKIDFSYVKIVFVIIWP